MTVGGFVLGLSICGVPGNDGDEAVVGGQMQWTSGSFVVGGVGVGGVDIFSLLGVGGVGNFSLFMVDDSCK